MDKRSTQLSLPITVEDKEFKEVVKQHWNITFARQGKISVVAKRMMALVLAQIQDNDMKLKPYYQMHASDVVMNNDGGSAYDHCKRAFEDLASVHWMIEDIEAQEFAPRHILDTTKVKKKDGFETAYKKGQITLAINPALEPYFIGMAHYSKYEIGNYMRFKSWYSMRLWEILSAYQDTGAWYAPLEEYRKLMDCEKKYPLTKDLINKTLAEPLEELKGTNLEFTYKKVFSKFHGKGRPPVIGLEFHLIRSRLTKVPQGWFDTSERHNRVLTRLIQKWKVDQAHICKYAEALTLDGMAEIERQFVDKENSKNKIENKKKYCNAAFVKAGKKAKITI